MNYIGLADCNSFYASCERIFRPDLRNRPIVVLSNNDGCIVALSKEAKDLGITRGIPYFQAKETLLKNGVAVFSSNYTLYQDISDRVSSLLKQLTYSTEKYSVDESFFTLGDISSQQAQKYAADIAKYLYQGIGVPVSVGIARTKTLAKIANHIAKKGNLSFVLTPEAEEEVLKNTPVEEVWGVGWRSAYKAVKLGLKTAFDFACCDDDILLKTFTVNGYNTARELRGIQSIDKKDPAHLFVSSSISFAKPVSTIADLKTALACHCTTVCSKLFADKCEASGFSVQLITERFKDSPQNQWANVESEHPTGYLPSVIQMLTKAMERIYKPQTNYRAMRVAAWNITEYKDIQDSLFDSKESFNLRAKQREMSKVIFTENKKIVCSSTGFLKKQNLANARLLSPAYTTRWDSLPRCM